MSQCWCFYCDHAVLVNDGLEGELLPQLPDRTNGPAGGCGHVEIQMSQCWCFCTDHAVLVNDGLEGESPCLRRHSVHLKLFGTGRGLTQSCSFFCRIESFFRCHSLTLAFPSAITHSFGRKAAVHTGFNIISVCWHIQSSEQWLLSRLYFTISLSQYAGCCHLFLTAFCCMLAFPAS